MGSQEGSPSDNVGITSEIASVIREFTEPVSEDGDIIFDGKLNGEFVRFNYFIALSCFRRAYTPFIMLFHNLSKKEINSSSHEG